MDIDHTSSKTDLTPSNKNAVIGIGRVWVPLSPSH